MSVDEDEESDEAAAEEEAADSLRAEEAARSAEREAAEVAGAIATGGAILAAHDAREQLREASESCVQLVQSHAMEEREDMAALADASAQLDGDTGLEALREAPMRLKAGKQQRLLQHREALANVEVRSAGDLAGAREELQPGSQEQPHEHGERGAHADRRPPRRAEADARVGRGREAARSCRLAAGWCRWYAST